MELYICIIVLLSIVVGIPTCVKTMEVLLMYKFCKKFDEDEGAYVGGVTICECLTNLLSPKKVDEHAEQIAVMADEVVEDHYDDIEGGGVKLVEEQVNVKPKNKCVVCLLAFFCCKRANTVSKESELAQIKLAANTAS